MEHSWKMTRGRFETGLIDIKARQIDALRSPSFVLLPPTSSACFYISVWSTRNHSFAVVRLVISFAANAVKDIQWNEVLNWFSRARWRAHKGILLSLQSVFVISAVTKWWLCYLIIKICSIHERVTLGEFKAAYLATKHSEGCNISSRAATPPGQISSISVSVGEERKTILH